MTPEQFCYWLQGFFEISNGEIGEISAERAQIIQDHLELVFNRVTPDRKKTSLKKFLEPDTPVVFGERDSDGFQKVSIPSTAKDANIVTTGWISKSNLDLNKYPLDKIDPVITITQRPLWDSGEYCLVRDEALCGHIAEKANISPSTPILIDYNLTKDDHKYTKMSGSQNHLVGIPVGVGYGLTNIGRGAPLAC